MNKIIIAISLLVMLMATGCGSKETIECEDCKPHKDAKVSLMEENNNLKTEIINLKNNITELKNKTTIANVYNASTIYLGDCTTCTRLLNQKEKQLEDCWLDDSDDRYRDLYKDCREDRKELREENDETITELEKDLFDCHEDLELCEEDLDDC